MADRARDDLLDAARRGEDWAIAELYRDLHPPLVRYLRRHVPTDFDDLASETWLGVARQLPSFAGDISDFRALVFTIARRRVADFYRGTARRPTLAPIELADDRADVSDLAESVVAELSSDEAVERLVADLPPPQAEVVMLRVVAGLSVEEVALAIGRRPGTVRVLQHRALRRLARANESDS